MKATREMTLGLAFGAPATEAGIDGRIGVIELMFSKEHCPIGLRMDRVDEVAMLDRTAIEVPPAIGMRRRRAGYCFNSFIH